MSKRILVFLLTGGLLLSIVYLLNFTPLPGEIVPDLNHVLLLLLVLFPPLILLINCFFMLYFNSTRLLYMNWLILLTYLYYQLPGVCNLLDLNLIETGELINYAILYSYFLPLLFFIIHITSERGFLTFFGLVKLFGINISALLPVVGLLGLNIPEIAKFYREIPVFEFKYMEFSSIFLLLLLLFCLVLIFIRERSFYGQGQELILWAVIAFCLVPFFKEHWWINQPFQFSPVVAVLYGYGGLIMTGRAINYAWVKAYMDKLTMVEGRLALDEHLDRLSGQYAVAMVDIDNFKDFNDKFGHDAGDLVLQQVADLLDYYSSGFVYRFGGEEFTIIYPGKTAQEVKGELLHIRRSIENNKVTVTRKSRRATKKLHKTVTVSIGLAEAEKKYGSPHTVLNAADNALFKAKKEGRNKLCKK